jgi:hypothetical protein
VSGGKFKPGQSGNPSGKQPGTRHKITRAIEALLEGEHEALGRKAIEKALEGDMVALRLCLERLAPARKDAPVSFALPPIETVADAKAASAAILAAVSAGDLTPSEGSAVMGLLVSHKLIVEATDFEARLAALEGRDATK